MVGCIQRKAKMTWKPMSDKADEETAWRVFASIPVDAVKEELGL